MGGDVVTPARKNDDMTPFERFNADPVAVAWQPFFDKISTCDRLACALPPAWVCPNDLSAYCEHHPPTDAKCEVCGFEFDVPEVEFVPEPANVDADALDAQLGATLDDDGLRKPKRKGGRRGAE